ncbi:MAG TPA: hypothetical protein DCZ80_02550 [Legionellales bacterium]|nr:hypothetical protein [Legionellales bacterium]
MKILKFSGLFILLFAGLSCVNNSYSLDGQKKANTVQYQSSLIHSQRNLHRNHPSLTPLREMQLHRLQTKIRHR